MALGNRIENGIIAGVTMVITVLIFGFYNHFFVMKPILNELAETRKIVERVAMKDTYSISNDFEKMRTKGKGSIVLDLNNELNHNEMNLMPVDSVAVDSVTTEKKGFFKRLFGGKKK